MVGRRRQHPDAGDSLHKLDCLCRFPGYKVALIGDSVVFGHSLAEHGNRLWRQHGLAPLLAERIAHERPRGGLMVMNLGLNGAARRFGTMRRFLAACRPDLLVCDVGLRSFSSDFAAPEARYSRKWLAEMSYVPERPFVAPWPGHEVDVAATRLALRYSSLCKYRDFLQYRCLDGPPHSPCGAGGCGSTLFGAAAGGQKEDEMVLMLQGQRRFQGVNLDADNPQRQAFQRMLRALADSRQKTLLFYAKEDPARIENLIDGPRYRALRTQLDGLIAGCTTADLVYLPPLDALRRSIIWIIPISPMRDTRCWWSGCGRDCAGWFAA